MVVLIVLDKVCVLEFFDGGYIVFNVLFFF